jgi:hypothetical protein
MGMLKTGHLWDQNRPLASETGQHPRFALSPGRFGRSKSCCLEIKKCDAWLQCLADRGRGKVKHCYENDKRWR